VLCAPPGTGKTTGVPLHLLKSGVLDHGRLIMLEPRRVAARSAARRMASLLGQPVGETVGYRIRHDTKVSKRTRIEVVTEGVLTRMLHSDPELTGIAAIVFDEIHERSIAADLALALTLDVRSALRPDLKLLAMSATLDAEALASLLGDVPQVICETSAFTVSVSYGEGGAESDAVCAAVNEMLTRASGSVLVFLPGFADINRVARALANRGCSAEVVRLHGALPSSEQDEALREVTHRRVILSTNVAETSLTIAGVDAVVDCGLARINRFDPASGMNRLVTERISHASATQRAGRAGRTRPGFAMRLWPESEASRRERFTPPELVRSDLAPLAMDLALWGVSSPDELRWLDAPPPAPFGQAQSLLQSIGVLDEQRRITGVGRAMARLPVHPRLMAVLSAARTTTERAVATTMVALLDEGVPWRGPMAERPVSLDDAVALIDGDSRGAVAPVDRAAVANIKRTRDRLRRELASVPAQRLSPPARDRSAGALLAAGYPDRVAAQRGGRGRFVLPSGGAALLPNGTSLAGESWIVAPVADVTDAGVRVRTAEPLARDELMDVLADKLKEVEHVAWDDQSASVQAETQIRLGQVTVVAKPLLAPGPQLVGAAMLAGVRRMGLACLPWSSADDALRHRVRHLARWQPDDGWPLLDDETLFRTLDVWLEPYLAGITRRDHLSRLTMSVLLRALLPPGGDARLARLAPEALALPCGQNPRLDYSPQDAPVLAIPLQWAFGLKSSPRVAEGRVPVTLHLLSPGRRPLQVTQDLAGFWAGSYAEVRKEMRGRYPKHHWPEEPANAAPVQSTLKRHLKL
jgi:ATP-dependent helicase HrpB